MRNYFVKVAVALCVMAGSSVVSFAQDQTAVKPGDGKPAATTPASASAPITAASTPLELARAALQAQGGEKYKNLKSLVLIGEVNLYAPNSAVAQPGKFVIVQASGDRYRLDVVAPVIQFKQIFDGEQGYSSIPTLAVLNPGKYGLGLLTRFDQAGYTVAALPDRKKQRAFRITGPEGAISDFFINPMTARVEEFTAPFMGGLLAMEQKNMKEMEGVFVPYSLTQRFETPQGAFFAEFKVKTANINQPLGDDVFTIQ